MATFKFTGTITVYDVDDQQDAINALQTAVDDYEDMNPGCSSIIIHWDKVEQVDEPSDRSELPWDYGKHFE